MSTPATQYEILADLARVFDGFQGREYSGPITLTTRFFADLGFASIDAVVLGETLESRYVRPLPFGELIGELGSRITERQRLVEGLVILAAVLLLRRGLAGLRFLP